jgi:uncharacterized membrane protein YdbT with pleckstrin-like domain
VSWRSTVLSLLRVPPEPEPPPGSPPRVFRAAPNFFKLRLLRWGVTRLFALFGLIWGLYFIQTMSARAPRPVVMLLQFGEILGWAAFAFELIFGLTVVRLDYELRWYMVSDRAIRIREGILSVREKTIALANIQNIAVHQGPLQRLLGLADVEVKTAGGGGGSHETQKKGSGAEPMHVAFFRGVDNAALIRDLVSDGVRRQRDSGLGDPDDQQAPAGEETASAASMLLEETRRLRAALSR